MSILRRWLTGAPASISQDHQGASWSEGQCDCACLPAVPARRLSSDMAPGVYYKRSTPFLSVPLISQILDGMHDEEIAAHACLTPTSPCIVLNPAACQIVNHFDIDGGRLLNDVPPQWYETWGADAVHTTLIDMLHAGVLIPATTLPVCPVEMPDTLSVWLHITNRCNMRCAYCYVPHTTEDMSIATGRAAIDASFRSAMTNGFSRVKIKYAGGEPLICYSTIRALHHYALHQAQEYGLSLDGVILSNGTLLTLTLVTEMRASNLRLMLSLDGIGNIHDQQRYYADGRGTYADVVRALECALAYGLVPEVSVTVSGRTVAHLPDVVAFLLERDVPFSLNFYRNNDRTLGQPDLALNEQETISKMQEAYRVIEANLPRRSLLNGLLDRTNLAVPHVHTCGVGVSSLVFGCDGRVVPCQMQMQQLVSTVDADDLYEMVREQVADIQNRPVSAKEACSACAWAFWCAGGCSLMTYRATGWHDARSPLCAIYRALLPDVLRLEGLRLVQLASQRCFAMNGVDT